MNKRGRLLRNLKAIGGNHLTPGRYATLLKLSGFTLDEAVAEIKYLADRDKIKNIQNQIDIICHRFYSNTPPELDWTDSVVFLECPYAHSVGSSHCHPTNTA